MNIDFSRNLIKGKIAELIFQEMFQAAGEFTVLPLGYEHTTPILAQYQHFVHVQKVLDNLRHAPDFALISQDKTRVFLVEVKYRSEFNVEEIVKIAQDLNEKRNPCFLFLAAHTHFYFDSIQNILSHGGIMQDLQPNWIKIEIQNEYVSLLNEFIR